MATGLSEASFADITQLDQQEPEQQGLEQQELGQRMPEQKRPEQLQYVISGIIDFSTVPALAGTMRKICESYNRSAHSYIKSGTAPDVDSDIGSGVELDFSQVTQCNSAGLALVLEMSKAARTNNLALHYKNLPDSLLSIAKAYGVESEIRELGK